MINHHRVTDVSLLFQREPVSFIVMTCLLLMCAVVHLLLLHILNLDCRCEQTLFNAPGEALALTDAARLFLSSEKENRALQAPGFDEHLQAALNCYSFAIKVRYYSQFLMTALVRKATVVLRKHLANENSSTFSVNVEVSVSCRQFLWNIWTG